MRITFSLCLPRDGLSVPVARRICRTALSQLGVEDRSTSDIEIALTEACTNVLKHTSLRRDEYEVTVDIDDEKCTLRVVDRSGEFDAQELRAHRDVELAAEGGRGILLMRALVDDLAFESKPEVGTIVRLEKRLGLKRGSVLRRLTSQARA